MELEAERAGVVGAEALPLRVAVGTTESEAVALSVAVKEGV